MKTKPKLPANQRAASESKKLKLKAVVHFNRLISVRPLEASPNQIVLVGRSPAHIVPFRHTKYTVIFHVENSKSLILM